MRTRIISLTLFIPGALTLKDKRQIIQSMIARIRKLNVSVAEIGYQDQWQRSRLGMAVVSNSNAFLDSIEAEIIKLIETQYPVEIVETIIEEH
ncbi:MAG: DUF503 domain-containing protein [Firmicutes bacterium]|nr:DUF503 domain-containing protein [Bacillota bacterium]